MIMSKNRTIYTIGSAGKTAQQFFSLLKANRVRRIIDVRLWNRSQLAGFAKQGDLRFFLTELLGCDYVHARVLAPSGELLDGFKKNRIDWQEYVEQYAALLAGRRPEAEFDPSMFDNACLLCSERSPDQCHRRLAAEHLQSKWGGWEIVHL